MLYTITRWVFFLPIAILGPIIFVTVLKLIGFILGVTGDLTGSVASPLNFFGNENGTFYLLFEYAFVGGFFVIFGSYTAPDYRKVVSTALAIIVYIYLVLQIFIIVSSLNMIENVFPVFYGIAAAIGASIAMWSVYRNPDSELTDWFN